MEKSARPTLKTVAPYAGAWIEIPVAKYLLEHYESLPTRERGLKCLGTADCLIRHASLPTRERGLKWIGMQLNRLPIGSLPTRERGLKSFEVPEPVGTRCRSLRGSVD